MGLYQDPLSPTPPPLPDAEDEGPKPIGVPRDYVIKRRTTGREEMGDIRFRGGGPDYLSSITPIYFDGAEYLPANWPASQIWSLQQYLAKVGLLTGTFTRNVFDPATMDAYKELLALSNAKGANADQTLQEMLSAAMSEEGDDQNGQWTVDENGNVVRVGGSGSGRAPLTIRTTDPASLRRAFRRAVIDTLGEGWTQEQINQMVGAYNQIETSKQQQAYGMAETGGTISDIPSPEDFIATEIEKRDPAGVQEHEALGFVNEFASLASSPAWGVG